MHTSLIRDRQPTSSRRRQRGTSLVEALIAFLVLTLGLLAVARLNGQLRLHSDTARQRAEAVRLAQQDLETLRGYAALQATPGLRSYAELASATSTLPADAWYAGSTAYTLTRQIGASAAGHARNALVGVAWTDRRGDPQRVQLSAVIAGVAPALAGSLSLSVRAGGSKPPLGRSLQVPFAARDLGNGSSAFKPVSDGTQALLFDNASGAVIGRCTGVAATTRTADLRPADLTQCDSTRGLLLSGTVRRSSATPPDPARAVELPGPFTMALAVSGSATPPACSSEVLKTVIYTDASGAQRRDVPLTATPDGFGLSAWVDSGERLAAYHCVVYPAAGSDTWSGRATLAPSGWAIGTGAAQFRVCRYSADLDGSGAIDGNPENPGSYGNVASALANQNFLVVNGAETCPRAAAVRLDGSATDVAVDLGTTAHQP